MAEIKITKTNFQSEGLNSPEPILIDFWAAWCGPCRMLSPVIEEIANENIDKFKVGKVNVDEEPELASAFGVDSIPMLVVVKNGKVIKSSVGYKSKEAVLSMLEV